MTQLSNSKKLEEETLIQPHSGKMKQIVDQLMGVKSPNDFFCNICIIHNKVINNVSHVSVIIVKE